MGRKILTFELSDDHQELDVHFDRTGLSELINHLERLLNCPPPCHDHLMTESWAGSELTEAKQGRRSILLNKVNFRYWPED